jgi:hypothetical protein
LLSLKTKSCLVNTLAERATKKVCCPLLRSAYLASIMADSSNTTAAYRRKRRRTDQQQPDDGAGAAAGSAAATDDSNGAAKRPRTAADNDTDGRQASRTAFQQIEEKFNEDLSAVELELRQLRERRAAIETERAQAKLQFRTRLAETDANIAAKQQEQ